MNNFDSFFWLIFVGIGVYFVFNVVRRGSLKGAIFNATIAQTVGEVEGSGPSMMRTRVKVHILEKDAQKLVGLEFVATSVASYDMMPLTLSVTEAKKLVAVLEQTIARTERNNRDGPQLISVKSNFAKRSRLSKPISGRSRMLGTVISAPEVTHVSKHGLWLLLADEEILLPFEQFPWFRKATIDQISHVVAPTPEHLYWPELDIDLSVESIRHPETFPLVSRSSR